MEPVTHFLTGACIGRAGLNRKTAYATLAAVLAAEAADIDILWGLRGQVDELKHHRGITHTLIAAPVVAGVVETQGAGAVATEATIKIKIAGERFERTAHGNGPVNALDAALRSAIVNVHPHLRDIELVNYKVRIVDEAKGTGAVTRVLIDASDGDEVWGTIGVSENVIAASWDALVESLERGMLPGRGA